SWTNANACCRALPWPVSLRCRGAWVGSSESESAPSRRAAQGCTIWAAFARFPASKTQAGPGMGTCLFRSIKSRCLALCRRARRRHGPLLQAGEGRREVLAGTYYQLLRLGELLVVAHQLGTQ